MPFVRPQHTQGTSEREEVGEGYLVSDMPRQILAAVDISRRQLLPTVDDRTQPGPR